MEQNKNNGFPWRAGDMTKSTTGIFIKDSDGRPILRVYAYPGGSPDDLERVIRAVTNTYGSGINPEAVKDICSTLLEITNQYSRDRYIEFNESEGDNELILKARAALKKAKL